MTTGYGLYLAQLRPYGPICYEFNENPALGIGGLNMAFTDRILYRLSPTRKLFVRRTRNRHHYCTASVKRQFVKTYKQYHGQYVEISGKLSYSFEDVNIYTENWLTGMREHAFWLEEDSRLGINDSLLHTMETRAITIRGLVDTTSKGHLGAYLATIRNIYYWKQGQDR